MRQSIALLALAASAALAFRGSQARADFIPPSSFPAGSSQYEIIFVTTATTNAESSNISTYDSIVQSEVASDPTLNGLLPSSKWNAIVSTPTTSAYSTAPSLPGIPVYNTLGQLVAYTPKSSSESPLYSETLTLSHAPDADINGNLFDGQVWVGPYYPYLPTYFYYGDSGTTNPVDFLYEGVAPEQNTFPLYGLSGPINDPSPSPEPATITLLASSFAVAGGFGLRRRWRRLPQSTPDC
jgi:hypothetical protein